MRVINKIKSIIGYILFVLTYLLLFTYLTSCDMGKNTESEEIKGLKIQVDSLKLEIKYYKQRGKDLLNQVQLRESEISLYGHKLDSIKECKAKK